MGIIASVVLLFILLRFPGHPRDFTWERWAVWPLELPLLLMVLLLLPGRTARIVRRVFVALLGALLLLRVADIGSRLAFGRSFDLLAEFHLMTQGWTLASQTVGRVEALLAVVCALGVLIAVLWIMNVGLGRLQQLSMRSRLIGAAFTVVLFLTGVVVGDSKDMESRFAVANEFSERGDRLQRRIADQIDFGRELAVDPVLDGQRSPPHFAALADRDMVTLFVESYGRSWLDHERFSEQAATSLAAFEEALSSGGLHMRSAWVESPIRGGRSWLAHASYASGLMLTSQARFDRLISSDRVPLYGLMANAGWTSVVALPVVSKPWIEGAWYKVDQFMNRDAFEYKGKGFGYVTMPDQFTLNAFDERVRQAETKPVSGMVGLLGSHAPWTPLALPVPWESVGDGSIFDGSHRTGGPLPCSNPGPVRKMYSKSLEIVFARVGEYLVRYAEDDLFIVIGDHQPASIIAGWAPNAHVPMHVISRDKGLLDRLPDSAFSEGAVPDADAPGLPMAELRTLFSTVFEMPLAAAAVLQP